VTDSRGFAVIWLLPVSGKDQFGMPSFITVLKRVAQLWEGRQSDLEEQVQASRNKMGNCGLSFVRSCEAQAQQ
jgi:uncharacterized protein YyaL (SSP411 family)